MENTLYDQIVLIIGEPPAGSEPLVYAICCTLYILFVYWLFNAFRKALHID